VQLEVSRLQPFVELFLEVDQRLVRYTALLSFVDEVVGPVERDAGPASSVFSPKTPNGAHGCDED
jgi:hypothetical protein